MELYLQENIWRIVEPRWWRREEGWRWSRSSNDSLVRLWDQVDTRHILPAHNLNHHHYLINENFVETLFFQWMEINSVSREILERRVSKNDWSCQKRRGGRRRRRRDKSPSSFLRHKNKANDYVQTTKSSWERRKRWNNKCHAEDWFFHLSRDINLKIIQSKV